MERRDFLKKAGAGTAVAAGTLAAPAIWMVNWSNMSGNSVMASCWKERSWTGCLLIRPTCASV